MAKNPKNAAQHRYYAKNRERIQAQKKAYREANPDVYRNRHIKSRYGITLDQWEQMFEAQERKCKICGTMDEKQWATDHDHSCCPGAKTCGDCLRGILCHPCNLGIGTLGDDPERLRAAAEYLEEYDNEKRESMAPRGH